MKLPTIPPGLAGKIVKTCPLSELIRFQYFEDSARSQGKKEIPLISRVFGPYYKFRAWAINRWKKTRIRNLQYGPKKRG